MFDSGQARSKATVKPSWKGDRRHPDRPNWLVAIHGHTDDGPSHRRYASNWELSVDRATQVARALVQTGIQPIKLSIKGYGEDHPIYPNDSDDNRMKNRRVEISILRTPSST